MTGNQDLINLLQEHFPEISETVLSECAEDLEITSHIAMALQDVDRSQKPAKSDLALIEDAIKHLRRSEKALRSLGSFGGHLLRETAHIMIAFRGDPFAEHRPSGADAKEIVVNRIAELRCRLEQCAVEIQQAELPDLQRTRGAPKKIAAEAFASRLYDVFEMNSGRRPVIITNRSTNEKGGPFLQFVKDMFHFFGIEATPEYSAQTICNLKNQKKE